ncbi:MAG: hypothetical protein M1833_003615 [Piccolia ochrophora]|nr:MAG: hypothetical protein M1833_003615 [Piccolia ochrophora]
MHVPATPQSQEAIHSGYIPARLERRPFLPDDQRQKERQRGERDIAGPSLEAASASPPKGLQLLLDSVAPFDRRHLAHHNTRPRSKQPSRTRSPSASRSPHTIISRSERKYHAESLSAPHRASRERRAAYEVLESRASATLSTKLSNCGWSPGAHSSLSTSQAFASQTSSSDFSISRFPWPPSGYDSFQRGHSYRWASAAELSQIPSSGAKTASPVSIRKEILFLEGTDPSPSPPLDITRQPDDSQIRLISDLATIPTDQPIRPTSSPLGTPETCIPRAMSPRMKDGRASTPQRSLFNDLPTAHSSITSRSSGANRLGRHSVEGNDDVPSRQYDSRRSNVQSSAMMNLPLPPPPAAFRPSQHTDDPTDVTSPDPALSQMLSRSNRTPQSAALFTRLANALQRFHELSEDIAEETNDNNASRSEPRTPKSTRSTFSKFDFGIGHGNENERPKDGRINDPVVQQAHATRRFLFKPASQAPAWPLPPAPTASGARHRVDSQRDSSMVSQGRSFASSYDDTRDLLDLRKPAAAIPVEDGAHHFDDLPFPLTSNHSSATTNQSRAYAADGTGRGNGSGRSLEPVDGNKAKADHADSAASSNDPPAAVDNLESHRLPPLGPSQLESRTQSEIRNDILKRAISRELRRFSELSGGSGVTGSVVLVENNGNHSGSGESSEDPRGPGGFQSSSSRGISTLASNRIDNDFNGAKDCTARPEMDDDYDRGKRDHATMLFMDSPSLRARTSRRVRDLEDEADQDGDWETVDDSRMSRATGTGLGISHAATGSSLADNSSVGSLSLGRQDASAVVRHPADVRYEHIYRVRQTSPEGTPILLPAYNYDGGAGFPNRNALTPPMQAGAGADNPYQHPDPLPVGHVHPFRSSPPEVEGLDQAEERSQDIHEAEEGPEVKPEENIWRPVQRGSFSKWVPIGPRFNITGTPEGTGMREVGSSLANHSSPGESFGTNSPPHKYSAALGSPIPYPGRVILAQQQRREEPVEPQVHVRPTQLKACRKLPHPHGDAAQGRLADEISLPREAAVTDHAAQGHLADESLAQGQRGIKGPVEKHACRSRRASELPQQPEMVASKHSSRVSPRNTSYVPAPLNFNPTPPLPHHDLRHWDEFQFHLHRYRRENSSLATVTRDQKQAISRVMLALCLIFPPLLLLYGYGLLDNLMLILTRGDVGHFGRAEKKIALWLGWGIATAAISGLITGMVIVASR